jgi:hypothetical protein
LGRREVSVVAVNRIGKAYFDELQIVFQVHSLQFFTYSIYYGNNGASSSTSISDTDHYIIIRKLLDSVFNFWCSYTSGKFRHTHTVFLFHKGTYRV